MVLNYQIYELGFAWVILFDKQRRQLAASALSLAQIILDRILYSTKMHEQP